MKVDVELEPFTPLLRPTYADAHAGAISEVRMEGYEFGHTYVWQGPDGVRRDGLNVCRRGKLTEHVASVVRAHLESTP